MKLLKELYRNRTFYVMMIPGLLLILVFNYLPMVGLISAFKDNRGTTNFFGGKWVGFDNLKYFFTSQDMSRVTKNTIFMNLIFIIVTLITSVTFALLLNAIRLKFFAKLYQSMMFIPYFLSWVVVGFLAYALLNVDYGFLNSILAVFNIEPIQWYGEPKYWTIILTIAYIWKNVGYSTIIYLSGMAGIDESYYEAATVDGATKLQQVFYITIPLITPFISIMTLLAIGKIFYADFGMFYYLPRETGILFSKTDVIDTYVYRALRVTGNINMAAAVNFYQSIVGFTLVLASNLAVKKINPDNALF